MSGESNSQGKPGEPPPADVDTFVVRIALVVAGIVVAGVFFATTNVSCAPTTPTPAQDKRPLNPRRNEPTASNEPASVEVIAVRLKPFETANGDDTKKVYVDWKNAGGVPVRAVYATIEVFDRDGRSLYTVTDYAIYGTFNDRPGIAPGETYIAPTERSGFILPLHVGWRADRASVRITRAEEKVKDLD